MLEWARRAEELSRWAGFGTLAISGLGPVPSESGSGGRGVTRAPCPGR